MPLRGLFHNTGKIHIAVGLTLASFEFLLRLIDHVNATLATHDLAIAVALLERAQRISDLHRPSPLRGAERLETITPHEPKQMPTAPGRGDHLPFTRQWWARQGSNL